jgi:Uri superfamily endonuclease
MPDRFKIPAQPGAYALQLHLKQALRIRVGRLGSFLFEAGDYIYFGSALGPGGLKARLERHLAGSPPNIHWHLDYLRKWAEPRAVAYVLQTEGERQLAIECMWGRALTQLEGYVAPVPGFGASDCKHSCKAHLIYTGESLWGDPPALATPAVLHRMAEAAGKEDQEITLFT